MIRAHISEISEEDALQAARMTGISFNECIPTDYGFLAVSRSNSGAVNKLFIFSVKTEQVRIGLYDELTPNIVDVCRFLESKYDFSESKSKTVEKQ